MIPDPRHASPATAEEWTRKAKAHTRAREYADALSCLEKALAQETTPERLCETGLAHRALWNAEQAAECFQAAINADNQYARAYHCMANLLYQGGGYRNITKAVEYATIAMLAEPDAVLYRNTFANTVKGLKLTLFHPELYKLILDCLGTEGMMHDLLCYPWQSLLVLNPEFSGFFRLVKEKKYKAFSKKLLKQDLSPLLSPYFLLGIRKMLVADIEFERFAGFLRRVLLENLDKDGPLSEPGFDALYCALAIYSFYTSYIFDESDAETKKVEALKARIEAMDENALTEFRRSIFAFACYRPLSTLQNAAVAARALSGLSGDVNALVKTQISDVLQEREIRGTIQAVTPIRNETSDAVRTMYESFPYPRWKNIFHAVKNEDFAGELLDRKLDMMVAGCGTGREAIEMAIGFPESHVLAVDLSLSSLSYGIRMAREMGVENISFRQADILELESLGKTFDFIASSGVLHHMRVPEDGLAVLTRILKPGGLMRIGLYSETARRHVVASREVIARKGYAGTDSDIKRFRRDAEKILKKDTWQWLLGARDYFSTPECCDLLFHVMEHRYEIPQLAAMLDRQGLDFMGFIVTPLYQKLYRDLYPDDPDRLDWNHWQAFEQEHKNMFTGTYTFWCRKTG